MTKLRLWNIWWCSPNHKDKGLALLTGSIQRWVLNSRTIPPPTYSNCHIQFCSAQPTHSWDRHMAYNVQHCAGSRVGMLGSQIIQAHYRGEGAWNPAVLPNFFVFRFSCCCSHSYTCVQHVTVMGKLEVLRWLAVGKIHYGWVSSVSFISVMYGPLPRDQAGT